MLDLSLIILNYNEQIHLERCLKSISSIVKDIYIVDSFSSDKTLKIEIKNSAWIAAKAIILPNIIVNENP